jgi:hypothetical protein
MGWENRNGKSYYYRKERKGGRVRSVYVGSGETARLIAQLDDLHSEEREDKRALARIERERWQEQDRELDRVCALIKNFTTGALLAAGFHTHKRQWRRRKEVSDDGGSNCNS